MATILYPDAAFSGDPDIETAVLAETGKASFWRAKAPGQIPDAVWRDADALVCYDAFSIDRTVVARLARCRIIVRAGVGVDHIDLEACRAANIPVCNTPDYGTTDVADHAIALMLTLARTVAVYDRNLGQRGAQGWVFDQGPRPIRLQGRVFGVVGLGRIGIAAGLRAKAFGMTILFYDPYVASGLDRALGFERAVCLDQVLTQADVISLHTPLTDQTRGMIDAAALTRTRPTALLINTARGSIVDTGALLAAIRDGRLAGAGLDVLPTEPPNPEDPLFAAWLENADRLRDRLILTPHAAFYSGESMLDLRRKSAEIVRDYLRDGRLCNCVNDLSP